MKHEQFSFDLRLNININYPWIESDLKLDSTSQAHLPYVKLFYTYSLEILNSSPSSGADITRARSRTPGTLIARIVDAGLQIAER